MILRCTTLLLTGLLLVACNRVLPYHASGQPDGRGQPDGLRKHDAIGPADGVSPSDRLWPPSEPAAPPLRRLATGTYVGLGNHGRHIETGFPPVAVMVKVNHLPPLPELDVQTSAVMKTSTMVGDYAKVMQESLPLVPGLIVSLDRTGFTVGDELRVNAGAPACGGLACTYYWVAFAGNEDISVGTYTGTGEKPPPQNITTVPFVPAYVMVMPAINKRAEHRMATLGVSAPFNASGAGLSTFDLLPTGGFTAGGSYLNVQGATYHYLAWRAVGSRTAVGGYVGNEKDRSILVGFEPAYVIVQFPSRDPFQRVGQMPAGYSCSFRYKLEPERIEALLPDGFALGTSPVANGTGLMYGYVAFAP